MATALSHRQSAPDLDAQLAHALVRRTAELIRMGREPGRVGQLAVIYSNRAFPSVQQEPAKVHRFATGLRPTHAPVIGAIEFAEVTQ